jgi:hypothetical protein
VSLERIIVEDRRGVLPEGEVLSQAVSGAILGVREISTLPVSSDLIARGPVSGYMRRSFGSGLKFSHVASRSCQVMLHAEQGVRFVHWMAKLTRDGAVAKGVLRLAHDSSQVNTVGATLVDNGPSDMQHAIFDEHGIAIIGGKVQFQTVTDGGFVGLCLYGNAEGIRVRWLAVTQTP